jgi:LacI family transcriptional regulator
MASRARITMSDIAAAAGLSRPTVSLALSNKGTIAEETRQRVLAAARRLGFRPHAAAKTVVTGRSGMIGVLLSRQGWRGQLPADLLAGIDSVLAQHEQHLIVAKLDERELALGQSPRILREITCDGFLVNYNVGVPPELGKAISESNTPAIWLNDDGTHPGVRPDDFSAAREAVRILHELGHRRIGYVDMLMNMHSRKGGLHISRIHRHDGYLKGVADAGLSPVVLLDDPTVTINNYSQLWGDMVRRIRSAITGDDPVTAWVAYSGEEALIWEAAAWEKLTVPADLSMITFGDERSRRESYMVVPLYEIGETAARLLMQLIAGERVETSRVVPLRFDPGGTIAPAPRR